MVQNYLAREWREGCCYWPLLNMVNMLCTWVNIIFNFVYVWNSHNKKLEKLTQNIFMVIYIVTGRFRTKIHISWFQIMFFYYIAKLTILLYPDGCQVALSVSGTPKPSLVILLDNQGFNKWPVSLTGHLLNRVKPWRSITIIRVNKLTGCLGC